MRNPTRSLSNERLDLPEQSLFALHAGMGLALANRILKTVAPCSHDSEIRRVLEQFVVLCRDNSRNGYTATAYESLGLVAHNLYPTWSKPLIAFCRKSSWICRTISGMESAAQSISHRRIVCPIATRADPISGLLGKNQHTRLADAMRLRVWRGR